MSGKITRLSGPSERAAEYRDRARLKHNDAIDRLVAGDRDWTKLLRQVDDLEERARREEDRLSRIKRQQRERQQGVDDLDELIALVRKDVEADAG